jgi:hypothetical protein
MYQYACEIRADVIIISEPNNQQAHWFNDNKGNASIWVTRFNGAHPNDIALISVTPRGLLYAAFLTVVSFSTPMSQTDRLMWPARYIQCNDQRINVVKQRVLEISVLSPLFYLHKEGSIRDYRREPLRDPSVVGVVSKEKTKEQIEG